MKNFRKLATLCSALLLSLGLAGFAACSDALYGSSPESSESNGVSVPESSAPESDENGGSSTPETPETPETPNEPEEPKEPETTEEVQYEEIGYFTKNVFPLEYSTCSHELDAGLYYVTSYGECTSFTDFSGSIFAELTERGALEFDVCYSDWAAAPDKEVEVDYYIYKIIPVEMDGAECSATLLALDGAITPVNVTLAEAGVYTFSVNQEVSFFSSVSVDGYLAFQNYYTLFADGANTEITLYIGGLESVYGDVELTFALEKAEPVAVTEATQTLSLAVAGDNAYAFTAAENGAYRIAYDMENLSVAAFDSQTNRIAYAYDSEYFEFDYTGEPVVFFAKYTGFNEFVSPYGSSVTVTRIGDAGYRNPVAPDDLVIDSTEPITGAVPINSVQQDIPLKVVVKVAAGEWSIAWDNENVKVYDEGTLVESGYRFSVEMAGQFLYLTVHNETDSEQRVTFTLTDLNSDASGGNTLSLGVNTMVLTVSGDHNETYTFTAEKAGKYRMKTAEDETNAEIYDENGERIKKFPYEFELETNADVTFLVTTTAWTSTTDALDLVIEYYDEATQAWVRE